MPNYSYKCNECGEIFDKNVPMSQYKENQLCTCGGIGIRKITFSGSVWAPTSTGSNHK